jgi:hypothetical protein
MNEVLKRMQQAQLGTDDDTAAAILVLADAINGLAAKRYPMDEVGHSICMGIRKGLFGAHADDNSSVLSMMPESDD